MRTCGAPQTAGMRALGSGESDMLWRRRRMAAVYAPQGAGRRGTDPDNVGPATDNPDGVPSDHGEERDPGGHRRRRPAELTLWVMGRRAAARVRMDGIQAAVTKLAEANWKSSAAHFPLEPGGSSSRPRHGFAGFVGFCGTDRGGAADRCRSRAATRAARTRRRGPHARLSYRKPPAGSGPLRPRRQRRRPRARRWPAASDVVDRADHRSDDQERDPICRPRWRRP